MKINGIKNNICLSSSYKWAFVKIKKIGIKKNLYVVGAPSLENLNERMKKKKNFSLIYDNKKKIIVACFHPETTKSK